MIVKAPGVVKLLGEHAVVYGRLSLAVGINRYATASLSKTKSKVLEVEMVGFAPRVSFSPEELGRIYEVYKSRGGIDGYISGFGNHVGLLPFATIAARLHGELGMDCSGVRIKMSSDIPIQKGLASSAALCTAFTVAMIGNSGAKVGPATIIDLARDGERVVHMNENAGMIDVSTALLGGLTSFSAATGARKEQSKVNINMMIVDTGPKKSTAETVGHVADLYNSDKEYISSILDRIEECSAEGLDAINRNDLKSLGVFMYKDHELLQMLGVSTPGLDKAVSVAKESGALGAKLSGGGGGGAAIIIFSKNRAALEKALKKQGFSVMNVKVSETGALDFLKT